MRNKCCDLRDLIIDRKLDIFAITETWLHVEDSAVISSFIPSTHEIFHLPRSVGRGGGVCLVVRKGFENVNSVCRTYETFECVEVHISHGGRKLCVCTIYRPPQHTPTNFFTEFEELLLELETTDFETLYLGDFNIWMDDAGNSATETFRELLHQYYLTNFINSPTFLSGHILDLVISGEDSDNIVNIEVEPIPTLSDHMSIHFQLHFSRFQLRDQIIKFRRKNDNFTHQLLDKFTRDFNRDNFECEHAGDSPCTNCIVLSFNTLSREVFDLECPLLTKRIKIKDKNVGWYDNNVHDAKKQTRKAETKYQREKTETSLSELRRARQIKRQLVDSNKKEYYLKRIDECGNDSRKLFKELNFLLGRKSKDSSLPFSVSKNKLANDFRNFFINKVNHIVSSFDDDASTSNITLPDLPVRILSRFSPVTEEEALQILRSMNKTYCLNDPFDAKQLNLDDYGQSVSAIFADIANHSFSSGVFPESEKFALVKPLLKKGKDPNNLSSYRPLYNTSFLSKFFEKAALTRLIAHIQRFNFIPEFQSAYSKDLSVETAMCRVFNDILKSKVNGECIILILLDLTAAFDSIDVNLLLNDLENIGVSGDALSWFTSYLTDRKFSV